MNLAGSFSFFEDLYTKFNELKIFQKRFNKKWQSQISQMIQKSLQWPPLRMKIFWFRGNIKYKKPPDNHFFIKFFLDRTLCFWDRAIYVFCYDIEFLLGWKFWPNYEMKNCGKSPNINFYWSKLFSEILPFWDRALIARQIFRHWALYLKKEGFPKKVCFNKS